MKKLKSKLFWTIFVILSLFVATLLTIFNYQDYHRSKVVIEQNLMRMNNERNHLPLRSPDDVASEVDEENNNSSPPTDLEEQAPPDEEVRRFMDATIYTVLLDENNEIIDLISHTEDGTVEENIKEVATNIIEDNTEDTIHIGNLYTTRYSYHYQPNNQITIIDNGEVNHRLINSLQLSIFLFILLEIVILIISQLLSAWMIKPVKMSFDKQKQFIADASHELKTPLAIIMASAESVQVEEKEQKWLNNIKSESERMNKLISSLLDLAKIENEVATKPKEVANLSKLVEMSILSFESLAYEKEVELTYEIEKELTIQCNGEEIKELMSILLDNAIKHSTKKGKINVELKADKNHILLKVTNKGNPIPPGEEEKIFERFYRVDKARNRKENRYGLGLAIAKGIVDNHHGKISASSKDDYTTFTVMLKK